MEERHAKLSLKKSAHEAGLSFEERFAGGGASSSAGKRKARSPERLDPSSSRKDLGRATVASLEDQNKRLLEQVAQLKAAAGRPSASAAAGAALSGEDEDEDEDGDKEDDDEDFLVPGKKTRKQ